MIAVLQTYLKESLGVSDEDIALMSSLAIERTLRRKEILLREGEVCRYKVFVAKGFLRTYGTKEDGSEHIIRFTPDGNWTTEIESYHTLEPSRYYIDALEDSDVVLWHKNDFDSFLELIDPLKDFTKSLISTNIHTSQHRIFSTLSTTAEERYEEFIRMYPLVFARVPLHMVASYLGVSRETLSRIRHAQLHAK